MPQMVDGVEVGLAWEVHLSAVMAEQGGPRACAEKPGQYEHLEENLFIVLKKWWFQIKP